MNLEFIQESLMPPEYQPTFSPAWRPSPHVRSSCGPLVCDRYPCAVMRFALATATLYRQELQVNEPSPLRARSPLINACCVERTTIEGAAAAGAAPREPPASLEPAGALLGVGDGAGFRFRGSSLCRSAEFAEPAVAALRDAVSAGGATVCLCCSDTTPTVAPTTTTSPIAPNHWTNRMAGG